MANRNPLLGNRGGTKVPASSSFEGYKHPATSRDGAAPALRGQRGATQTINNKSKGRVKGRARLRGAANRSGKAAILRAMSALVRNAPAGNTAGSVGGHRPGRIPGNPSVRSGSNVRGGANRGVR